MSTPKISIATVALAVALTLVACTGEGGNEGAGGGGDDVTVSAGTPRPSESPPVAPVESPIDASPTPPALPEEPPPTQGEVSLDCVNGWVTPGEGSPRFGRPLGVIRRTSGIVGPLEVVDMRFFVGPESPPSDKAYLRDVQRWYVKLYSPDDLWFQGRFLVESRFFGRGVAAVASYDTSGFRSPQWIGFQYDSADPEPKAYGGLPGLWSGIPYDFVGGGGGLEIPGLPEEVAGCLDGT